jgi:hypothetical protein
MHLQVPVGCGGVVLVYAAALLSEYLKSEPALVTPGLVEIAVVLTKKA